MASKVPSTSKAHLGPLSLTTYSFTEIIRGGINGESDLSADLDYSAKLLHKLTPIYFCELFGRPRN